MFATIPKPVRLVLFFSLFFVLFFKAQAHAFDFSDVRRSLKSDLAKAEMANPDGRLAILFGDQDQEQIKYKVNLVALKKDLAFELLKSFQVADPVAIYQITAKRGYRLENLSQDANLMSQFAQAAGAQQVLLVNLHLEGERVMADLKLVDANLTPLSQVLLEIPTQSGQPVTKVEEPKTSLFETSAPKTVLGNFSQSFVSSSGRFLNGQNHAWMFFAPTAYMIPDANAAEVSLWLKDLTNTDIRSHYLRYDALMLKMLMVGIQAVANSESGPHSAFVYGKFQLVDETHPFAFAAGAKRRIYYNSENLDFKTGDDTLDEKNDKRNKTSLFLAASAKLKDLGVMGNLYLDNQTAAAGAKYLITEEIMVFAEANHAYYEGAVLDLDEVVGVEFHNAGISTVAKLSYQIESEQTLLGVTFNF